MKKTGPKIFVVDDDFYFRKAVARILCYNGYDAIEVSSSIPVINSIIKERPDLILLDLYMPNAGGMEIINTMRRMNIDIPVVVISGLLTDLDIRILQEKGVKHFMAKPVRLKMLIKKVNELFEKPASIDTETL